MSLNYIYAVKDNSTHHVGKLSLQPLEQLNYEVDTTPSTWFYHRVSHTNVSVLLTTDTSS